MEIVQIQIKIESLIDKLSEMRLSVRKFGEQKADSNSEYEKQIALTILKLKNGIITEFEGVEIKTLPATVLEKIARGICWKYKYEAELAETKYKAAIVAIDSLKAELNGYQSIYRYSEYSTND